MSDSEFTVYNLKRLTWITGTDTYKYEVELPSGRLGHVVVDPDGAQDTGVVVAALNRAVAERGMDRVVEQLAAADGMAI